MASRSLLGAQSVLLQSAGRHNGFHPVTLVHALQWIELKKCLCRGGPFLCVSGAGSSKRTTQASSTGDLDTSGPQEPAADSGATGRRISSPSDATTEDWGLYVLVAIGEKWLKPLSQVTPWALHGLGSTCHLQDSLSVIRLKSCHFGVIGMAACGDS